MHTSKTAQVDRKVLFKSPPTVFTDKLISQEARRSKVSTRSHLRGVALAKNARCKALEEQKRVCVMDDCAFSAVDSTSFN
jgi:hypothetical protein